MSSNCDYDLPSDFVEKNRQCLFDRIAELAEAHGRNLADNSCDDSNRNAGRIFLAVLRGWRHGLKGTVPPDFEQFVGRISRESDPDWDEYVRLHRKFDGRRP